MVDTDDENARKWINIDQIDGIGHQQNISYPSQQAGQGAQAAAWWSTGWWPTRPQIDFNFGCFSSNCRDQNPPWRHHYIMSSCCLGGEIERFGRSSTWKMWNFSKISIHQCFPFTFVSFIAQYIVKNFGLAASSCLDVLPLNTSSQFPGSQHVIWKTSSSRVHSSILPPTQTQQCQSPRSIQGAVACEASVSRLDREHCRPSTAPRFSPGMLPKRPPIPAAVIFSLFWVLKSWPSRKTEQKRFLDRIVLKFPESIVLNCYWTAMALSSEVKRVEHIWGSWRKDWSLTPFETQKEC